MLRKIYFNNRGEGYIDVCIIVLVAIMVIALMMTVIPVLIAKNQLDNFADELAREAEIVGCIGSETTIHNLSQIRYDNQKQESLYKMPLDKNINAVKVGSRYLF